ncbi:radical SAM protein [Aminipila luticellarii]|uniref:Radical SAM protein n=1 Tax=Aminipila luticellarii TaxID=2507160 RepID=A0A410PYS6_9FIRM|nr:radical SAM protein [Aminipila luticellarii]QAT44111.1 radical SAM protein [Aminipila luticellarii]
MSDTNHLIRYSVITEKNPREIVLLRGNGCKWRRCSFCDYHLDFNLNPKLNYQLNAKVLAKVTGQFKRLEVINSGSFSDLDQDTMNLIKKLCIGKGITTLYFECHWMDRLHIAAAREAFGALGIRLEIKGGVETFDRKYRESVLCKGIDTDDPKEIAEYYDQICLLFGITGQTQDSMERDLEIGLTYFKRVCVNLMSKNSTAITPDKEVLSSFMSTLYPRYKGNPRVDILVSNTDFGVGGTDE